MGRSNVFRWLVTMLVAMCAALADVSIARAGTILSDNISAASGGTESATGDTWLTASFGTDGSAYNLTSITLLLERVSISGIVELDLYSDGGLIPDSLLGSLTAPGSIANTLSEVDFSTSGIALDANTTYWVVLKAVTGEFAWSWANDSSGSGVGFQHAWGVSEDAGDTWFTYDSYPTQMRVTATAVPEPRSFALIGIGISLAPFLWWRRRRSIA